jgi:prolyl-tRNA synthetase
MGLHKSVTVRNTADALYQDLKAAGVDVILDDRDTRPGIMFADWELIGAPLRITIGDRGLDDGIVEVQARRQDTADRVPVADALATILERLKSL